MQESGHLDAISSALKTGVVKEPLKCILTTLKIKVKVQNLVLFRLIILFLDYCYKVCYNVLNLFNQSDLLVALLLCRRIVKLVMSV